MSLIVIRLHPDEPTLGTTFTGYLTGLTVEAFDLSTNDPLVGTSLGTAVFRAPANPPPQDPFRPNQNTDIVQHWGPGEQGFGAPDEWKALATAIIPVPAGAGAEHSSRDLRLVITRGTNELVHRQVYFNVELDPRANRPPRRNYPNGDVTSLYLTLPAPAMGVDTDDYVEMPEDGSPPRYADLRAAMQAVLDNDPGAGQNPGIGDLTAPQARHVAYEIIWNQAFRLLPAPKVRFTGPRAAQPLESLYTLPETGDEEEGDEINRRTFEGDLRSYYATGNADAERLAPFVYAMSAAIRAETTSAAAPEAGFLMPVSFALNWKAPVRVGSAANVVVAAPGATVDGVALAVGDRVALMRQTNPGEEGIYDWNGPAAAMTRSSDADTGDELVRAAFAVREGTAAGQSFVVDNRAVVLGTTDLVFKRTAGGSGARFKSVRVVLASRVPIPVTPAVPPPLATPFSVPAQYFYALGATLPTTVTPDQRYRLHTLEEEETVRAALQQALDKSLIAAPGVNPAQAARRLRALGAVQGAAPRFPLNDGAAPQANVRSLVTAWLAFQGPDIDRFWSGPPPLTDAGQLAGHLALVLRALTLDHQPLIDAIMSRFNPASVDDIDDRSASDWADLFPAAVADVLLPSFTQPGNIVARTNVFLRHVQRFFAVVDAVESNLPTTNAEPPRIPRASDDLVSVFADTVPGGLRLVRLWNPAEVTSVRAHIASMLPDDPAAQSWLFDAVTAINQLSQVVGIGAQPPLWPDELAFSLMEALYARGFTKRADIAALGRSEFRTALLGTVAWERTDTLHGRAGGQPDPPSAPGETRFQPINPDHCLVNCVPPPHRSPLGPVAYLHDLLQLTSTSTCDGTPDDPEARSLAGLVAGRRGNVGTLAAGRANTEVPIPVVDLVNECLEALAERPAVLTGVVYDTHETTLGGHALADHDPAALFAALPEHSTPATPVRRPAAYDRLRTAFTAPMLPYSQALDIARTYLCHLRTNRYAVMRRFRAQITELVTDPANQPADFQSELWRYPVRPELASEYLCLSPEETERLFAQDIPEEGGPDTLVLYQLFGYDTEFPRGDIHWYEIVVGLHEFLPRTGLTWCEFLALWRAGFVRFTRAGHAGPPEEAFPDCEPCRLEEYQLRFLDPESAVEALRQLAVFVRLWRKLQAVDGACYPLAQVRDLAVAFQLFRPDGTVNPGFVRQLAAFQLFRDEFRMALTDLADPPAADATGPDRIHLLALWDPAADKRLWAVGELIDQIGAYARRYHRCRRRGPQFVKLLFDNLRPLALLAGFDPDPAAADRWDARPTHTLRFAEVLAKVYASDFGIGELLALCTAGPHLGGDDPFPLQPDTEAVGDPLALPDDDTDHSLWRLRERLRGAADDVSDDEAAGWTWDRIEQTMRDRFGYAPPAAGPDPLRGLGARFFPGALAAAGIVVTPAQRQYRTLLAPTSAAMWNTPPGPFRYDSVAQELVVELPLTDVAVIAKLSRIRQLSAVEQRAVRELYFAPRADLAPFAAVLENLGAAVERLVEEPDEERRFAWFQHRFALFYRRCNLIARHLVEHVDAVSGRGTDEDVGLAWSLLRHLYADENLATDDWERDTGQPSPVTWPDRPSGGAFAALLGLLGTGLLGEYTAEGGGLVWRETRGPLTAFGAEENVGNTPVPTVLPAMDLAPTAAESEFVDFRNGFATANADGALLAGAQGYHVRWTGTLLVEADGQYTFHAGAATPDGEPPDFTAVDSRWLVSLQRGQRRWVVLSHRWPDETVPGDQAAPLHLLRGAYELTVELTQPRSAYTSDRLVPSLGGFQLAYAGPDTGGRVVAVPYSHLFRTHTDATLSAGIEGVQGNVARFLDGHYTGSLRDIRRTYQRAFFALLFAHRLSLSARPIADDGESEIGYLLAHPDRFVGAAYYRAGAAVRTHRAYFDPDLMPVRDSYLAPDPADDQRAGPSVRRRQALFDWFERLFDYTQARRATASAPEPPLWLLFHEAAENHPDIAAQLQRHLRVDRRHLPQVLTFVGHAVTTADLADDRWTLRVWRADAWLDQVRRDFSVADIRAARPDLWAADDPGAIIGGTSGNATLTRFVRDGCIENGEPRRYADIKHLNDGLRLRGRAALLAYLRFDPATLGQLLLLDVDAGLCERATRIEDAVSAVQALVRHSRIGLESVFPVSAAFALLWDRRFATYRTWEACVRRELYRENWVDWAELERARRGEAFRFLEDRLRRGALTAAVPGGLVYWPSPSEPTSIDSERAGLVPQQAAEPATLLPVDPAHHGFDLRGTPGRHGRPSWLAAAALPSDGAGSSGEGGGIPEGGGDGGGIEESDGGGGINEGGIEEGGIEEGGGPVANPALEAGLQHPLPWWVQAAIRLGVRFVRVAAAGDPDASGGYRLHRPGTPESCCSRCDETHPHEVDEYYFWLLDARWYPVVEQVADDGTGTMPDPADLTRTLPWSWHDPLLTPRLLSWPTGRAVHLAWSRVHHGEFTQPRRSAEPLAVPAAGAELVFSGRLDDSLLFRVPTGAVPVGYAGSPPAGFRYDLATDTAVPVPEVLAPPVPAPGRYPGGLAGFPFFVFHAPGSPLLPASRHAQAVAVATHLRAHCRFEAALHWYALAYDPMHSDNDWLRCPRAEDDADSCCHDGTLATDAEVRSRAILLNCLETLDEWGETLLRAGTPESFQQARVVFDTVARLLGPSPRTVTANGVPAPAGTVATFAPTHPPLNPRLLVAYERNQDRLALMHACLNARRLRGDQRPFWADSTLRSGWVETDRPCLDELDACIPDSPYRFTFLVQRAHELAADLRTLGANLLAAYTQGDSEYLASLRAGHERQVFEQTVKVREYQWREADWQVQALEKSKEMAETRLRYTTLLIEDGTSNREDEYLFLAIAALAIRATGNIAEGIAQGIGTVPDIFTGVAGFGGSPLFYQQVPLGTKLASVFATAARIANSLSEISGSTGAIRLTEAGWERREDEWRHQVEVLNLEIKQIERQILASERRRDIALRELNSYQRQVENAAEVHDFLRDRFTAHELYLFLQRETAALHAQTYDLALHAARQAERAFNLERGHTTRTFVPGELWDQLHEGLQVGERLTLALRQMEQAYLDANCREYEVTQDVSLRQLFPAEFVTLQATGECEIELPEWLFDWFYPGMYMRRIKNVSLTIPSVVGPYAGVHCRLTLLSSTTRVDPRLIDPPHGCCPSCDEGTGYEWVPDDTRFVTRHSATEATATSGGMNDPGTFELNFLDDRYRPFEFAGALSRWRIELPPENNGFPSDALGDIVMHVSLTAREGGEVLRAAANRVARRYLPGNGLRYFDVNHDLPNCWRLLDPPASRDPRASGWELPLAFSRTMFPFLPGRRRLWMTRVAVLVEAAGATPSAVRTLEFQPADGGPAIAFAGVATAEWPNLFYGVVDLPRPVPLGDQPRPAGILRLPATMREVTRVQLLCRYVADDPTDTDCAARCCRPGDGCGCR